MTIHVVEVEQGDTVQIIEKQNEVEKRDDSDWLALATVAGVVGGILCGPLGAAVAFGAGCEAARNMED